MLDYILPATVVVLKMFFRLYVGHTAGKVDIAKAMLAFPIDLAFLAISFSAIFLGYMQSKIPHPLPTQAVLGIFLIYVLAAGVVVLLVKKSDGAFLEDQHWISVIAWTAPAYFISTLGIIFTIWAWGG